MDGRVWTGRRLKTEKDFIYIYTNIYFLRLKKYFFLKIQIAIVKFFKDISVDPEDITQYLYIVGIITYTLNISSLSYIVLY